MKSKSIIVIGLAIILLSILFDIIFINIPPQDAPPELLVKRQKDYEIKNLIWYIGLGVLGGGLVLAIFNWNKK